MPAWPPPMISVSTRSAPSAGSTAGRSFTVIVIVVSLRRLTTTLGAVGAVRIARIDQLLRRARLLGFDHEVVLEGEGGGCRPRGDTELREDVLDVPSDGVLADDELRGDLPVALPGGDEPEHLQLAPRQAVLVPADFPRQRVQPSEVRRRSELVEDRPGSVELQRRGVVVANGSTREAEEGADAGGLVRRLQLLPRQARAS